jgi:hypothetical protein
LLVASQHRVLFSFCSLYLSIQHRIGPCFEIPSPTPNHRFLCPRFRVSAIRSRDSE